MDEEKLTKGEFDQLRSLLRRYCAFELDQWDLWKTETPYGTAFIDVMRVPREAMSPELYVSLDTNP
jgi:hypothetical protein